MESRGTLASTWPLNTKEEGIIITTFSLLMTASQPEQIANT
jgi:hypothetical protein